MANALFSYKWPALAFAAITFGGAFYLVGDDDRHQELVDSAAGMVGNQLAEGRPQTPQSSDGWAADPAVQEPTPFPLVEEGFFTNEELIDPATGREPVPMIDGSPMLDPSPMDDTRAEGWSAEETGPEDQTEPPQLSGAQQSDIQ